MAMADQTRQPARQARLPFDTWAVIAAAMFVLAICLGTLPRLPW